MGNDDAISSPTGRVGNDDGISSPTGRVGNDDEEDLEFPEFDIDFG